MWRGGACNLIVCVLSVGWVDGQQVQVQEALVPSDNVVTHIPTTTLLQQADDSDPPLMDFPGCYLGYQMCGAVKDVGLTAAEASLLAAGPDKNVDEWMFDGHPTCISRGPTASWAKCHEDITALHCAGTTILGLGTPSFGTASEQASALRTAVRSLNHVLPECPGCTAGRTLPNSPTVCRTLKGETCEYACSEGYAPNGTHVCNENGTLSGGRCDQVPVNPEREQIVDNSLREVRLPEPQDPPTTPVDVAHENWTEYREKLEFAKTAAYKIHVAGEACLYLHRLAEHLHKAGYVEPRHPLRVGLIKAAKAAECEWVHDEVPSPDNQEFLRQIPVRGDHGPWPKLHRPWHLMVDGYGPVVLDTDNITTGQDLYDAMGRTISSQVAYTIYLPLSDGSASSQPLDDGDELANLNLHPGQFLHAKKGKIYRRARAADDTKRPWKIPVWQHNDPHKASIGA